MHPMLLLGLFLLAAEAQALSLQHRPESRNAEADALFEDYWNSVMENDPEAATMYGDHRFDDKLTRNDLAYQEENKARLEGFVERAKDLLPSAPDDSEERFNLELLIKSLEHKIGLINAKVYLFPISRMNSPDFMLMMLLQTVRLKEANDYRNLIARYKAIPQQVDQIIELLQEGIRTGNTQHEIAIWKGTGFQTALPEESPFYEPFKSITNLPPEEAKAIQDEAKAAINNFVFAGFKKLAKFVHDEYRPHARPDIGVGSLPNGQEMYKAQLTFALTDSTVTPQQVHQMGLQEVERLKNEINNIIKSLGFSMTHKEFQESLKNDPSQFFTTSEEVFNAYKSILLDVITPKLFQFFKKIPKAKLKIQEVPPEQSGGPTAFYVMPEPDGSHQGIFFVDSSDPNKTSRAEVVVKALHEGLPGHHMQFGYALDEENVPKFRKYDWANLAIMEGWGSYAESLGFEMGLFDDDYKKYHHYSNSLILACNMVVDTGIHAHGWTRDQAIEYLSQNTPLKTNIIPKMVDKYITMPAQFASFKYGEMKIKQLRKRAEEKLGDKFDIREFHDIILRHGGPLELVAEEVDRYIARN